MPYFLHQWSYKDQQVKKMILEVEDRAEIIGLATEAFGGKLHHFFYCFGDHDGMAISEFPDQSTALACVLAIFGQGSIHSVQTTLLFSPQEGLQALRKAHEVATPPAGARP